MTVWDVFQFISIHAPVKGATFIYGPLTGRQFHISIHAPVKGATGRAHGYAVSDYDFNPRSREGSDWSDGMYSNVPTHFNPRSREGSDKTLALSWGLQPHFNPRSREGSDWIPPKNCLSAQISIHAPVKGATRGERAEAEKLQISIHAPVKGATIGVGQLGAQGPISIHAPVKGATPTTAPMATMMTVFQSTLP